MNGNVKRVIAVLIIGGIVIFALNYVRAQNTVKQIDDRQFMSVAQSMCTLNCQRGIQKNQDLSAGPCISNEIAPDWVCDVAHNPRQAIDDLPENQCSAYKEGKAKHFVEVDETCNLIRAI